MRQINATANFIKERAHFLFLEAKAYPETAAVARAFLLRATRWAISNGEKVLAETISGYTLELGEARE